jgi:hypothetical protein
MKKLLVLALASSLAVLAIGISAPSAEGACFTAGCFNKQISRLQRQVRALRRTVRCLKDTPVTRYGTEGGAYGYLWVPGSVVTTALDATNTGDAVGAFFVIDTCRPSAAFSPAAATAASAGAALQQVEFAIPPLAK